MRKKNGHLQEGGRGKSIIDYVMRDEKTREKNRKDGSGRKGGLGPSSVTV